MTLQVEGTTGVTLNVRILRADNGPWYVCFYDTRYRALPKWSEFGQPCAKYFLSTIAFRDNSRKQGLCLNSGVPDWNINSAEMQKVWKYCRDHAERVLNGKEA
jgi:hypothetical protein